jgi:predicted PurR-regulated permease PerM
MLAAHSDNIARNAQVVTAVILAGVALIWLAPILTPLALAVFLMLMVDALARDLHARLPRLGAGASMGAAVITCSVVFAAVVFVVASRGAGFVTKLFGYQTRLNEVLHGIATKGHLAVPRTVSALIASLNPASYIPAVAGEVQTLVTFGAFVLIYLGFLLAARGGFERKIVRLFRERVGRHEALQVFVRIRDSLERYLFVQTVCGAIIAVGSFAIMLAVGLDSAFFWAFLIFVIGYIPIVGAAVGILAPTLFAFLQFTSAWPGIILGGGLFSLAFLVGNIVLPRMQGRALNIDPVMVLLSLAFWGALWGPTGMFLSTPLTLLVMVVLAQFDGSRWIAIVLSADGDPHSFGATQEAPSPKSEAAALTG